MRPARKFCLLFAAGLVLFAFRPEAWARPGEDWYSVLIGGQNVGYLFQKTEPTDRGGQPLFRTMSETRIVLNRLGSRVEMLSSAEYFETEGGCLLEVNSELKYSAQPVRTEARVANGQVVVRTSTGASAQERKIPFSGELLGPEGARLASQRALREPGNSVAFQSFLPELSQLVLVTQTLTAVERLPEAGPEGEALKVEESYSVTPQKRTVWLDRQGRTLRSSDPSPFGDLVVRLTTKEEALALPQAGDISAEKFRDTLIKSNIRLPQARLIESVTLRLEKKSASSGFDWPAFDGPGQAVIDKTSQTLTLKVERPSVLSPRPVGNRTAVRRPDAQQLNDLLQSNLYLNADDALLVKTVNEALAGQGDPLGRALLLRNWVSDHMRFDLGIAFAPSSEIIRNLKGTCAEYAILLAAMLRAAGIPSRFLMGYVYLNGIWGGHAWVEASIDGQWLPLDAAVISPGVADAARFSVARSSLNEGLGDLLGGGQSLFGNLRVSVLSYTLKGKRIPVDARAPLSVVLASQYINAGLGLRARKLAGFVFFDLDKSWPERTLLAMKGPGGEIIQVLQDQWRPGKDPEALAYHLLEGLVPGGARSHLKVRGKSRPAMGTEKKAAVAILNGVDVWLILAEGGGSLDLLKTVLSSFSVGPLWPSPDSAQGLSSTSGR